jgi:hypothetical protein
VLFVALFVRFHWFASTATFFALMTIDYFVSLFVYVSQSMSVIGPPFGKVPIFDKPVSHITVMRRFIMRTAVIVLSLERRLGASSSSWSTIDTTLSARMMRDSCKVLLVNTQCPLSLNYFSDSVTVGTEELLQPSKVLKDITCQPWILQCEV